MRKSAGWGLVVLVGIVGACAAKVARAESIDRRVRLGIDTGIVEIQSGDRDRTTLGLGTLPVGPVIGFGLSERALIGARLEFVHRSGDSGLEGDTLGGGLTATLAFVGGDGAVRPFIGPLLGVRVSNTEFGAFSQDEHVFTLGAQAGIHAFPISNFSIDPSLVLGYFAGTSSTSFSGPSSPFPTPVAFGGDISGFVIGVRLAVSGWLGGKAAQTQSVTPEPAAYRAPSYPQQSYPPAGYPQQQPGYPQQQPGYPQQQPGYPQQQPGYPPQQPGYQAPPSSPPPTSSSPSPALPPSAPAP